MIVEAATPIAPVLLASPETLASACASEACYRRAENVGVLAVVVAELKFRDVERQEGAKALLAGQYHVDDAKPRPQWVIRVSKIVPTRTENL